MADATSKRSRSFEQISAELARERQGLSEAFAALRREAAEASSASKPTMALGRKAVFFVPALATVAAATVAGLAAGLRSRSATSR
jgi:hypothetical protein